MHFLKNSQPFLPIFFIFLKKNLFFMIKNVPDSAHSAQKVFNLDQIKEYLYGSHKLYKITE